MQDSISISSKGISKIGIDWKKAVMWIHNKPKNNLMLLLFYHLVLRFAKNLRKW
ncbi:hypothetical protein HCMG_01570 [Helicobacter canadensis MIT 98-5491]|nr:hypothetical protein HCMG_01570 [Helicobacter canadensis MIT 98-5491]